MTDGGSCTVPSANSNEATSTNAEDKRTQFEQGLTNYTGSDPLDLWSCFITWSKQNSPPTVYKQLVKRCTGLFMSSTQYKNDPRYLKIWIEYVGCSKSPLKHFHTMKANGIGLSLALFWDAWAVMLETNFKYREAYQTYKDGIACNARPVERLKSHMTKFLTRMANRKKPDTTSPDSKQEKPQQVLKPTVIPPSIPVIPVETQTTFHSPERPTQALHTPIPQTPEKHSVDSPSQLNQTPHPNASASVQTRPTATPPPVQDMPKSITPPSTQEVQNVQTSPMVDQEQCSPPPNKKICLTASHLTPRQNDDNSAPSIDALSYIPLQGKPTEDEAYMPLHVKSSPSRHTVTPAKSPKTAAVKHTTPLMPREEEDKTRHISKPVLQSIQKPPPLSPPNTPMQSRSSTSPLIGTHPTSVHLVQHKAPSSALVDMDLFDEKLVILGDKLFWAKPHDRPPRGTNSEEFIVWEASGLGGEDHEYLLKISPALQSMLCHREEVILHNLSERASKDEMKRISNLVTMVHQDDVCCMLFDYSLVLKFSLEDVIKCSVPSSAEVYMFFLIDILLILKTLTTNNIAHCALSPVNFILRLGSPLLPAKPWNPTEWHDRGLRLINFEKAVIFGDNPSGHTKHLNDLTAFATILDLFSAALDKENSERPQNEPFKQFRNSLETLLATSEKPNWLEIVTEFLDKMAAQATSWLQDKSNNEPLKLQESMSLLLMELLN
ncbi:Mitotic spindle checkpoint component mad3 [Pelomyxa schiedti]|nr:Mitotic spindle checkpoint component mad3 [Pelomyxa schiedti]